MTFTYLWSSRRYQERTPTICGPWQLSLRWKFKSMSSTPRSLKQRPQYLSGKSRSKKLSPSNSSSSSLGTWKKWKLMVCQRYSWRRRGSSWSSQCPTSTNKRTKWDSLISSTCISTIPWNQMRSSSASPRIATWGTTTQLLFRSMSRTQWFWTSLNSKTTKTNTTRNATAR